MLLLINFPTVHTDGEGKTEIQDSPVSKETAAANKMMSVTPASVTGKLVGPVVSSVMTTALELRNPSTVNSKANSTRGVLPPEALRQVWLGYTSS